MVETSININSSSIMCINMIASIHNRSFGININIINASISESINISINISNGNSGGRLAPAAAGCHTRLRHGHGPDRTAEALRFPFARLV